MNSIEVNNLTKRFGSFTSVDSVSFEVKKGEIFGFLGANGAGKSTTIRMLCGILAPTEGDAIVGGASVVKEPDVVKRRIGYMSQKFSLYDDLTVEENIKFFGGVYGLEGREFTSRKDWVLELANLENRKDVLTGSLPGGIKQRLALGTAVIHRPSIVFLDEPTSGVDPISRRSFWEIIHNLAEEGTTVFVTTHYLEEAEYCGNIILINAGKLIAEGSSKELKTGYLNHDIYEVKCTPAVEAMEQLEEAAFVEEVSMFGNQIHIMVNDEFQGNDDIRRFLKDKMQHIDITSISKITPTLEDVFIHLLEKGKTK